MSKWLRIFRAGTNNCPLNFAATAWELLRHWRFIMGNGVKGLVFLLRLSRNIAGEEENHIA